jgi:hypothetical protein
MRQVWIASENALIVAATMFVASFALWVGVPLGALWVGSRLQTGTGSLGLALAGMLLAALVAIWALIALLAWLNRRHIALQALRGQPPRTSSLENVLVASAAVALVCFVVWFFGFSGSEPLPLKLSY